MPATATRNRISGLIEEADAEHEADLADAKAKLDALRAADDAVFDTPPAAIVTGYDSNGEARDFEVSNIHHEPEPLTTASASSLPGFQGFVSQPPMPGFEGHTADVVVVNFNGRLELNLQNARERRLWDDLAWGARVALEDSVYLGGEPRRSSQVVLLAEEGETAVQWAITRVSMPAPGAVAAVE